MSIDKTTRINGYYKYYPKVRNYINDNSFLKYTLIQWNLNDRMDMFREFKDLVYSINIR